MSSGIDKMSAAIKKKVSLRDHKMSMPKDVDALESVNVNTSGCVDVDAFEGVGVNALGCCDAETLIHKDVCALKQQNVDVLKSNNVSTSMHQEVKKLKTTVYFTEEVGKKFNEIYAKRILADNKTDKSILISEAIELLYQREKGL